MSRASSQSIPEGGGHGRRDEKGGSKLARCWVAHCWVDAAKVSIENRTRIVLPKLSPRSRSRRTRVQDASTHLVAAVAIRSEFSSAIPRGASESELTGMERSYRHSAWCPRHGPAQIHARPAHRAGRGLTTPSEDALRRGRRRRAVTGITISHELVHDMQDQHFNLDSLQQSRDDNAA